jgi:predicted flap endonuclease-1-like 5' DNA nuclease
MKEMANLLKVEGIGPKYAATLAKAGVKTTGGLLKAGSTPKGRKDLEKNTGISGKLILEWVNLVDLFRVKGVGEEYSDLLEEAGVDTVPELAQRKPENLHAKMQEVNKVKKLVRQLPSEKQVKSWVSQAKKLPRVVKY